jgi:hypothetical protein
VAEGLWSFFNGSKITYSTRNNQPQITVRIFGAHVKSKKIMNVLGVIFNCKLNRKEKVANLIKVKTNLMI